MLEEALQLADDDSDTAVGNSGKWRKDMLKTRSKIITSFAKSEERHFRTVKFDIERKESRRCQHNEVRNLDDIKEDSNEKDDLDSTSTEDIKKPSISESKLSKSKMLRQKLTEFLLKKKHAKEEDQKNAKPAFKVGIVHHPVAPFGSEVNKGNILGKRMRKVKNKILPSFGSKKTTCTGSDKLASSTKGSKHENSLSAEVLNKNSEVEEQSAVKNNSELEVQSAVKNSEICIKSKKGRKSFAPEDFVFSMDKQLPLQIKMDDITVL